MKKTFVKPTLTTINVLSQANLMANSGVQSQQQVNAYSTAGSGDVFAKTGFASDANVWSD